MGKPYSMDLRERVVASVEREGLSRRQAAVRYGVGISTVIRWVRRLRETSKLTPGKMGGHRPKKIAGEHRDRHRRNSSSNYSSPSSLSLHRD